MSEAADSWPSAGKPVMWRGKEMEMSAVQSPSGCVPASMTRKHAVAREQLVIAWSKLPLPPGMNVDDDEDEPQRTAMVGEVIYPTGESVPDCGEAGWVGDWASRFMDA